MTTKTWRNLKHFHYNWITQKQKTVICEIIPQGSSLHCQKSTLENHVEEHLYLQPTKIPMLKMLINIWVTCPDSGCPRKQILILLGMAGFPGWWGWTEAGPSWLPWSIGLLFSRMDVICPNMVNWSAGPSWPTWSSLQFANVVVKSQIWSNGVSLQKEWSLFWPLHSATGRDGKSNKKSRVTFLAKKISTKKWPKNDPK